MLFEWECAYFMSSAITTPTTVSTTTAVAAMVASSNTTAAQGDLNEVTVPAILLSNDHMPKSNGTSNEVVEKRLKLKPWFKQISAEEIPAEKKSQTDSEIIPEPAQSVSAPEATATRKSKSKSGTSSKKVSLKTRKASLSAIVFKQLMAAGGQGIGVGINKDLPPAARQRPPVRRVPAVPPPADGVEVVDVKKSSSKTLSSESSGDPIPEHFGSTFEES
ncbi:AGAP004444-PA-like protein [Anopheles sinensis]|uniref:AGAP004444-PA-like protein n=1 Tax=Anopheles sinensis TaxID=74873 RepID=A0A084VBR1_ANOSI|nr:AGAP004444-PA-like protein [Anopheles sinensis]